MELLKTGPPEQVGGWITAMAWRVTGAGGTGISGIGVVRSDLGVRVWPRKASSSKLPCDLLTMVNTERNKSTESLPLSNRRTNKQAPDGDTDRAGH